MYYVSFEIETPLDPYDISDYRDKLLNVKSMFINRKYTATKDGVWFFKVYEDISCGAEFVTLPIELGNSLKKADVDNAADVVYSIMREIKRREKLRSDRIKRHFGKISTHITFTCHPNRKKAMPSKVFMTAINNVIRYYFPIIYFTSKYSYYPLTRSSYFRRYYTESNTYQEEKSDYPAVFVPSYNYNGLPPYHKVEFRVPDTLLLAKKRNIANLLDMYVKLMINDYEIRDRHTAIMYNNINRILERSMNTKGKVYFVDEIYYSDSAEKLIVDEFIELFAEKLELV